MKSPKTRKLTVWISLTAYLLVALVSVKGNFLCFEADGYVALEVAFNDTSCSLPSRVSHTDYNSFSMLTPPISSKDHCGPCIDIPLWFDGADQYINNNNGKALQLTVRKVLSLLPSPFKLVATQRLFSNPSPERDFSLTSSRTTILLI